MKSFKVLFALLVVLVASIALAANVAVYKEQGGAKLVVSAGGEIEIQDGGAVTTPVEVVTADVTATAALSSKTFIVNGRDKVITLPPTEAGVELCFAVMAVSTTTGFSISPDSVDAIHYVTSTDDKDLINTAATDVEGDSVCLIGDGAEGWWIRSIDGTWAKE